MKTDPCYQNLTSVSIAVIWLVVTMKVDPTKREVVLFFWDGGGWDSTFFARRESNIRNPHLLKLI